jgi:thymidylate synthase
MFFQVNILGGQAGPQTAQITGGQAGPQTAQITGGQAGPQQLHMTFYMRSADIALGVPYNIASYAILSHLLAREIGVQPGTVTCIMSNCHIYENHVELAREQTARPTFAFPTLDMRAKNIDEFINLSYEENINVNNYVHGAFIPYKMN